MASTTATLLRSSSGTLLPQAYSSSGDAYLAVETKPLVGSTQNYGVLMHAVTYPSTAGTMGQLTADSTAQQASTDADCTVLAFQNDANSTQDILLGFSSASLYMRFVPSQTFSGEYANVNLFWVKTTGGTATVNWMTGS